MKKQWLAAIAAISFCVSAAAGDRVIFTEDSDPSPQPVQLTFSNIFSEDQAILTDKQCQAIFTQFTIDKTGSFQSELVKFGPSKTTAIKLSDNNRLRVWKAQLTSSLIGDNEALTFFGSTLMTVKDGREKTSGLGNFIAGPCHGVVKAVRMPAAK